MKKDLDIVVPILNETQSLPGLVSRVSRIIAKLNISYRIIIVDRLQSEETKRIVQKLSYKYPVLYRFEETKNSADTLHSVLSDGTSSWIVLLSPDASFNQTNVLEMFKTARQDGVGVVFSNRVYPKKSIHDHLTRFTKYIVRKTIADKSMDSQSGLRIFRRDIAQHIQYSGRLNTNFNIPLLFTAAELGYEIKSFDVNVDPKTINHSKTHHLNRTRQTLFHAVATRVSTRKVYRIPASGEVGMAGAGVIYKRKRFLTHTTLGSDKSALVTLVRWQKVFFISVAALVIIGFALNAYVAAIIFIALLSAIYFADVFFNLFLVLRSLHFPPELSFTDAEIAKLKDANLPTYSILCPLYKEAEVLPTFVESINALDWPKDKLEVLLLLEEDDKETIEAASAMQLPPSFSIVVVPNGLPKTKPKACNYGLSMAKGEYVVIYDAEDIPDPKQLKKAYLGFAKLGQKVMCLQAKLNYFNPHQNLLTRLFTAEYSLWFDVMLPALQSIDTTIPLGGTSNHFRTVDLVKLEGWDPFNVTEDADLGVRMFKSGGRTAIIDSVTLEEANSQLGNWIRQRSRWLKGYMQTYLVHMREPIKFAREHRHHSLIFQLIAGLRIGFMIINPFLWAITAAYFLLYKFVGPTIESLYPTPVFYMAVTSAIFGNFLYLYYYMIGAAKREQWSVIKYVFLIPFYWFFTSVAAVVAFYQLIFNPHFWEKTHHGLYSPVRHPVEKLANFFTFRNLGFTRFNKLDNFSKTVLTGGGFSIFASMFGNFLNFLYSTYLGRNLELSDFGLISLIGSFVYISQVPLSALTRTVTYRSAYLLGQYETAVKDLWVRLRRKSLKISVIVSIVWILATPILGSVFKSESLLPFVLFTPVWLIGFAGAVDGGYLSGNMKFAVAGLMTITEATVKLLATYLLVSLGLSHWVYAAIPISMLISFLLGWFFASRLKQTVAIDIEISNYFPRKFFATSVLIKLSSIAFLSMDLILAKMFLDPIDAGRYSLLSVVGKMVYFVGALFAQFILPIVSRNEGTGRNSDKSFYRLLGLTFAVSFVGFIGVGLFGSITVPLLFGQKAQTIVQYLPLFTAAIVMQILGQSIINFHQSKNRFSFPIFGFIFASFPIVGISLFHKNLDSIVMVMFTSALTHLTLIVFIHIYYNKLKIVGRNVLDLLGIFGNVPKVKVASSEKVRILMFNWRDTKHMWSGGAEVYLHEMAKRWVKGGNSVTMFCGNDGKSLRNDNIDGVNIVRRGGFYTVYIWALLYYIFRFRGQYDVIIDSENGIPFFTPFYAKERVFLLIHHVHQDVFQVNLKPPLSWIGAVLEKRLMPFAYRNTQVITVSPSSKADILNNHLTNKEPYVIYNGVDLKRYTPGTKSRKPLVLYLGRIRTHKSLHIFVYAAKKVLETLPNVDFVIAGDGQESKMIQNLINNLGLSNKIQFLGKVSEDKKLDLFRKAWVFVNPSLLEGWGITTIEANACGTPVITSNVPGLRDAVHNPHSGLLVPYGNIDEFSASIMELINNRRKREQMSKDAVVWARKFGWDKSARNALNTIKSEIYRLA